MKNLFSLGYSSCEGLTDKKKGGCEDTSKQLKPNNSYELTVFVFIVFAIIVSATFGVAAATSSVKTHPNIQTGSSNITRLPGWLFFICLSGIGSGILSGYFFKHVA